MGEISFTLVTTLHILQLFEFESNSGRYEWMRAPRFVLDDICCMCFTECVHKPPQDLGQLNNSDQVLSFSLFPSPLGVSVFPVLSF